MTRGTQLIRKNLLKSMSPTAEAIYSTVLFFDVQDRALTLLEIKQHLISSAKFEPRGKLALSQIENILQAELASKIQYQAGLYFLLGRSDLVDVKKERYLIFLLRYVKCLKYLHPLRFFPYIRAIAISGSTAMLNSTKSSDIDLFILTKKNRIWFTRTIISLYFQLLGQRRYGKKIADRFCLNHYLVENQEIVEDRNMYTAVEYSSLLPIVNPAKLEEFWNKNSWVETYVAGAMFETSNLFFDIQPGWFQKFLEQVLDHTLGARLNYLLGIFQKRRIQMQESILVSESELSFHPGSRGQEILKKFQEKTHLFDKSIDKTTTNEHDLKSPP